MRTYDEIEVSRLVGHLLDIVYTYMGSIVHAIRFAKEPVPAETARRIGETLKDLVKVLALSTERYEPEDWISRRNLEMLREELEEITAEQEIDLDRLEELFE